jgi:hypothetical protein
MINYTIIQSYQTETGIATQVLYTFNENRNVTVTINHNFPRNSEEVISNILSRGETELEKLNILANVPNILNELNN